MHSAGRCSKFSAKYTRVLLIGSWLAFVANSSISIHRRNLCTPVAQEVEDYRLSNGLAAANMLAEISQADASATRCK